MDRPMSELDGALLRLQKTAPEYGPGLANHGPMVCEALRKHGCFSPREVEYAILGSSGDITVRQRKS